ncbi:hypothetical protein K504DRAFT_84738 [Pleomassaria siparia CBS 279.74]|uniref:Uncharacterized protein n=1 Tax=Pleomassaria siparia CBS 279.74 TaxID=1314801 RepID=A0A6G1JYY7_9PLEO|nr:hypothetical protein K504DRAFT_84738 [Pleomassaria siparia CBS 279.74]
MYLYSMYVQCTMYIHTYPACSVKTICCLARLSARLALFQTHVFTPSFNHGRQRQRQRRRQHQRQRQHRRRQNAPPLPPPKKCRAGTLQVALSTVCIMHTTTVTNILCTYFVCKQAKFIVHSANPTRASDWFTYPCLSHLSHRTAAEDGPLTYIQRIPHFLTRFLLKTRQLRRPKEPRGAVLLISDERIPAALTDRQTDRQDRSPMNLGLLDARCICTVHTVCNCTYIHMYIPV